MFYHLTDHQFSTVALIDSEANLLERVSYDAYGMARHHWAADLTGDGAVNVDDRTAMNAALNESIGDQDYNVDADITRTGTVTMTDAAHTGTSQYKAALPKGDLSGAAASGGGGWNTIGYCGYVFNPEVPTTGGGGGLYTVRFRHYDAEIGRWLERDPLGYVDGMSLYGYGVGSPVAGTDPFGQSWLKRAWEKFKRGVKKLVERGKKILKVVRATKNVVKVVVRRVAERIESAVPLVIEFIKGVGEAVLYAAVAAAVAVLIAKAAVLSAPALLVVAVAAVAAGVIITALAAYELYAEWQYMTAEERARYLGQFVGGFIPMGWGGRTLRGLRPRPKSVGCFLAGTFVATACGFAPIEDVDVGDQVWSYNQETQEWELRQVEQVFEHIYFGDVVDLTIQHEDGSVETIDATGNHPFWVIEGDDLAGRPMVEELPAEESVATSTGRWTEARHLRLGDHFLTRTGKSATVAGLTIRIERVKVYNLQVAELYLYAVGDVGTLVHNSVHPGKQGRHIPGHPNYQPGKSILTADPEELLRNKPSGTWHEHKEVVDWKRIIGYWSDQADGALYPTTRGTIHHAQNGSCHIVPAHPGIR